MEQLNNLDFDEGERNFKFSHYFDYKSVLGHGAFGTVVAAKDKKTGRLVAVKVMFKYSSTLCKFNSNLVIFINYLISCTR